MMKLSEVVRVELAKSSDGMTPQEMRAIIKAKYPHLYGTESHQRSVDRGSYKDLDHAILAQIYSTTRSLNDVFVDRSTKPVVLSLLSGQTEESAESDPIEENLEKLESGVGTLYVLGTNLFDKRGNEIIKIGITTGSVENRISQLYTTGVPYRYRVLKEVETYNYALLEQSLHKLLDPFRVNRSREFFLETALPYVEQVLDIHNAILANENHALSAQA
ncbi:GIY-YIG nuclease family protein [Vibrio harveyi]|uniref:GIY-YIG nuclease family protein n=1 Tax=Vibrio harveyi TaxID=669 RepID=UPI001D038213|nr:GIY-YIG nuclease family protein [Vibrio harveyi]